ncbi:MAG: SDR family oxidoreductase [Acidobacteriota bacterium]|jgi:hypothetical protein
MSSLSLVTDCRYFHPAHCTYFGRTFTVPDVRSIYNGCFAAERPGSFSRFEVEQKLSIAGINGMDVDPTYTAAKAGLLGFTKSTARYLGKHNITVNSVCPGPTDTELSRKEIPEEVRVRVARSSALGRMGTPEDVADVILFFASDYARHVTGQTVVVDGGIVMP